MSLLSSLQNRSVHPANNGGAHDWRARWYADLSREHGFEPLRIEGKVPSQLRGTLYRAGPATSGRFGKPYTHMFEGDGAIAAIRFGEGDPQGAVRFIRNQGFVAEERAGKPLFQSAADPLTRVVQALKGRSKNTANTSVMQWNDTLYALMEAAGPVAFDSELNTIGESDLDGVLQSPFSAHPHTIPQRNASYNFGVAWGAGGKLCTYEMKQGGGARMINSLKLKYPVMLHDFMATENHMVFFVSPARFKIANLTLGLGDAADFLAWRPEDGTEVIVVPNDDPDRTRRFKVDPFFQIHFGGGFEEGDDIVVDYFRYPDSSAMRRNIQEIDKPPILGEYVRARIPKGKSEIRFDRQSDTGMEFGSIDPRKLGEPYRYMFGMTIDVPNARDGVVRVDNKTGKVDSWYVEGRMRLGEPIFVPRSAKAREGDGFVIVQAYSGDSHTSEWMVFDTKKIADGPVCRAHLDHHIPSAFHGTWIPA